ncbi:glycosyltransferase [Halovivax limisalsi]|uniref:glycosyltransferase n=1 Tax=Halovivax limisalsi TaxID=1453760 RepID=UPI001FFDBF36|nr:glycosyltransferase [Halovivax limisalsi]
MGVLALTSNRAAPFFAQQVEALETAGVETRVCSVPGDPSSPSGRSPLDYVRFLARVRDAIDESIDLVHAHYGLLAPAAFVQRRLPVVLSLWGSDLYNPAVAPISRLAARASAETIVMSREMARLVGTDCHVIPDGVDMDLFRPMDRERARRALGWVGDGFDVLFPYAKTRSVKDYPRAKSVVDALDPEFDRPLRLRTVSGVAHDRIPLYMNAADSLLLTSRHEGSPNAVKEAMACNLPVVATAVGDVPERLDGVEPSAVCRTDRELRDGLRRVLGHGGRSNGRETVEPVRLERTTAAVREVYDRALDRADGPSSRPPRTVPIDDR